MWLIAGSALVTAGCSDAAVDGATTGVLDTPLSTTPAVAASTASNPTRTSTRTPTRTPTRPAPEPTGVAGVDDARPLCAAWATYSGTVQIIAVAYAFSDLSAEQLTQLELAASPSVVDAVGRIAEAFPGELAGERERVIESLLGRYQRRAARAVEALRAAGFDDAGAAQLVTSWDVVLRTRDPDEPGVALPATIDPLRERLGAAATAFDAANTPFNLDPSLTVERVEVPLTRALLAAQCPDLASSGVGDAL